MDTFDGRGHIGWTQEVVSQSSGAIGRILGLPSGGEVATWWMV
jgi:hypothetical protein